MATAVIAVYAMAANARPAEAPELVGVNLDWMPSHLLKPEPVMGIRGELQILRPCVEA